MNQPIENELLPRPPLVLKKGSPTMEAEVLYNSLTLQGEPLAPWLLERLQRADNLGVILFGESGAAKSTLAGQIVREVRRLSDPKASVTAISSGVFLKGYQADLTDHMRRGINYKGEPITPIGPQEEADRDTFTPDMWDYASRYLGDDLKYGFDRASKASRSRPSETRLVVADIAGIGDSIKTRRLASGLVEVARAFPKEVVFLAVPANPDIQDRSLRLRTTATNLIGDLLEARGRERLLTAENIAAIEEQPLNPEEEERIKKALEAESFITDTDLSATLVSIREGTRPGRFEAVRDAFLQEVLSWVRRVDQAGQYDEKVEKVSKQVEILQREGKFGLENAVMGGRYALKLAYAQDYFERVYGISSDSDLARVVMVPYLKTPIHQWTRLLR